MLVTIKKSMHGGSNYCAYKCGKIFATINGETPTVANSRIAKYSLCYLTGRVEWFDKLAEAKDYALRG